MRNVDEQFVGLLNAHHEFWESGHYANGRDALRMSYIA